MRKNGFIATSVLYSFFLVFITLFVALIVNYIQSKVLISNINDEARENLNKINNVKISDLNVGERVKFVSSKTSFGTNLYPYYCEDETESYDDCASDNSRISLISDISKWTVIDVVTNGNNKTITLLSDSKIGNNFKFTPQNGTLGVNYISVDIFNDLNNQGYYTNSILYNRTSEHTTSGKIFLFSIPTVSKLTNFINNSSISKEKKNAALNTKENFTVYNGTNYYNVNYTTITSSTVDVESTCGISGLKTNTDNSLSFSYQSNTIVSYANVVDNTTRDSEIINYCLKQDSNEITNLKAMGIFKNSNVYYTGQVINDKNDLIGYNVIVMAEITIDINDTDTYLSGGKGTYTDPYIISSGIKSE